MRDNYYCWRGRAYTLWAYTVQVLIYTRHYTVYKARVSLFQRSV